MSIFNDKVINKLSLKDYQEKYLKEGLKHCCKGNKEEAVKNINKEEAVKNINKALVLGHPKACEILNEIEEINYIFFNCSIMIEKYKA